MKSRKILSIILAVTMTTVLFTGCGDKEKKDETPKDTTKTEKAKDEPKKKLIRIVQNL